jgi:hypothetical protein
MCVCVRVYLGRCRGQNRVWGFSPVAREKHLKLTSSRKSLHKYGLYITCLVRFWYGVEQRGCHSYVRSTHQTTSVALRGAELGTLLDVAWRWRYIEAKVTQHSHRRPKVLRPFEQVAPRTVGRVCGAHGSSDANHLQTREALEKQVAVNTLACENIVGMYN